MIYLLHGDDTSLSRKRLNEICEGFELTHIDGVKLDVPTIEINLTSNSLFQTKKAIVVENLFSKNKNKKKLIEYVNNFKVNDLLIFWENKKVIRTSFQSLKNAKVEEFSLPQVYFEFLDSFTPQKIQNVYQLYHLLLLSTEATQVFYSLVKRLRALLIIQSGGRSLEIERLSPWQLSKLQNQARMWPKEKLVNFYKKLQDAEIKLKSGGLPVSLSKHLDILILSDLT